MRPGDVRKGVAAGAGKWGKRSSNDYAGRPERKMETRGSGAPGRRSEKVANRPRRGLTGSHNEESGDRRGSNNVAVRRVHKNSSEVP